MKKIIYLITTLILLFASCAGSDFSFDEESQKFVAHSTNFIHLYVKGIDNDDYFDIELKDSIREAVYVINLNEIPESFTVKDNSGYPIRDFKLKRNNRYKIENCSAYDTPCLKIVVYVNKDGILKELHNYSEN